MQRIIDLECSLPEGIDDPQYTQGILSRAGILVPGRLPLPNGYGFDNYDVVFKVPIKRRPPPAANEAAEDVLARLIADMDQAGVQCGVVGGASIATLIKLSAAHPGRFIGLAAISPLDGMRGVREFERLVLEQGIAGLRVSAPYDCIPASDRRYYPLYAKCVELGVPVRIYTSMTYANDRPYDLGHPRHLDCVAMDFPELRIVAGLSGWPWVSEMVALLRRHPNLYCDTAAHRPRHFATHGSGWEQFLQFGNTLLQDKIMIGLSRDMFGVPFEALIDEYRALPLKPTVLKKWFYENAVNFFRLS